MVDSVHERLTCNDCALPALSKCTDALGKWQIKSMSNGGRAGKVIGRKHKHISGVWESECENIRKSFVTSLDDGPALTLTKRYPSSSVAKMLSVLVQAMKGVPLTAIGVVKYSNYQGSMGPFGLWTPVTLHLLNQW